MTEPGTSIGAARPMPKSAWGAVVGLVLAVWGAGCVERTVTITSEPQGALVYLNDEEVGRTPVTVPFTFYGMYDVRLERAGYEPLWTKQKAAAPWWENPGPDLVGEAIPHNRVALAWHYLLEPAVPPAEYDTEKLLDHAAQLRARVQAGERNP